MDDASTPAATVEALGESSALRAYIELMEAFLSERVGPIEFESAYLDLFKSDQRMWPEPVYEVLNNVFLDVDAFCADPAIRGPDDLDEEQLRSSVAAALAALDR